MRFQRDLSFSIINVILKKVNTFFYELMSDSILYQLMIEL